MGGQVSLIKIRNPFQRQDRDICAVPYRGESLRQILDQNFPGDVEFIVSLNGRIVLPEELGQITVRDGDFLTFVPRVQGDNMIPILKLAAIIIVAAVVSYFLPQSWPMWAKMLAVTAATTATALTMNALLPPPGPKTPTLDRASAESSQVYSWNPQTIQQQGVPIPRVYGTHILYGNIIDAFIENEGDNQYLNVLLGLGMGPIKRLYDYRINDQPWENLRGVGIYARYGNLDQYPIPYFRNTKIEYPLSVKVVKGTPYPYDTIRSDFDGLEVDVTFPAGLWYANDRGGLDPNSVDVRIRIRQLPSGSWQTITHQVIDVETKTAGGYWSLGIWMGGGEEGYPYWYESATGGTDPYAHYDGEPSGGYFWRWIAEEYTQIVKTWVDYLTVKAAVQKTIRRTARVEHLSHGQYQIEVTNLTDDRTDPRYGDDMYVTAVRESFYDNQEHPRQVLVGIRALATDQLSGSLRFSVMCEGRLVRIWNGSSWNVSFSENPAWILWDIFTQPIFNNGFGVIRYDGLDPSRLDLDKFCELAAWCDELVPDGEGGTEKRITFNGVFDSATSMWEAALRVCALARCIPIPTGTQISLAINKATNPTAKFTVGNIKADSFKEIFLPLQERASELEIHFLNRDNDYRREIFSLYDPDMTRNLPPASLDLFGCTKASEAWRHGKYRLNCNRVLKRIVEFDADIDAVGCSIGDQVYVQHDIPAWGEGGRLISATSTSVTLDRAVTIEAGKSYSVMVRLQNDVLVTRQVTNNPGSYTVLNLSSAFDPVPQQHDLFWMGETTPGPKPFTVIGMSRSQEMAVTLALLEYNESVFGSDSAQPVIATPNYSSLDPITPVTGLEVNERLEKSTGGIRVVIDVIFTRPSSSVFSHAEIWYSRENSGWKYAGRCPDGRFVLENVEELSTYKIRAVSVNSLGQKEPFAKAPTVEIYVYGKTLPPEDISDLWSETAQGGLKLSWTPVSDVDLDYYEIRWHPDSGIGTWPNAIFVAATKGTSLSLPAAKSGVYFIKAVDTSGNESATARAVITTIPTILRWNVQETLTENPAWTGIKTKMAIMAGDLWLDIGGEVFDDITDLDAVANLDGLGAQGSTVGYYETAPVDLGSVQTARCSAAIFFFGIDQENLFDNILDFDAVANFDGVVDQVGLLTQIALSQNGTSFGDWMNFLVGDYTARAFKFRLKAYSNKDTQQLYVDVAQFVIDMPDRIEEGKDVSVGAGGLAVTFSKTFMARPVVGISIQSALAGDVIKLTALSVTGFTIQILDSGGSGVARTIDWEARGY